MHGIDDVARSGSDAPWSGPLAWMLDKSNLISPDSRVVNVLFAVPTCGSHGKPTPIVEYRPTQVAVEVRLDDVPNCLQAGGPVKYALELTEPVAQREIVNLVPAPAWPYQSLEEWGRIVSWEEVSDGH